MSDEQETEETFVEEAARLARERQENGTNDEDADLKLALATLRKIAERPARAPRGVNDTWGWCVGNEHAPEPGTETRDEVIFRIRRSYGAVPGPTPQNRDDKEKGALETITAMLDNMGKQPSFARHDLKRIVKVLETIIADRIGPGDDPSGKSSKYIILPGEHTGPELSNLLASPVTEAVKAPSDYVQTRSKSHPELARLEEQYGKTQVYVELQRIKLGMLPLNEDIAKAIAEIAEDVNEPIAELEEQGAPAALAQAGDKAAAKEQIEAALSQAGPQTQLADVLRRVAEEIDGQTAIANLGTPTEAPPAKDPRRFYRQVDFTTEDGVRITTNPVWARIRTEHFDFIFMRLQLALDKRNKPQTILEEAEKGPYWPFTPEYVEFITEAEKIYSEKKALADERIAAEKEGPITWMSLKWSDHAKGIPQRMADWQFHRWSRNFLLHLKQTEGIADWDLLDDLKKWNSWGVKGPKYEEHGPA
ncbi:MAG: hypothetical protein H6858_04530 [Rhodospirillales bacterium]|nr:hypothetical protein [Alphaproteobacteria bacterium]MCB9976851.1 hypothetical protein [Rhodospirillales bacterium]